MNSKRVLEIARLAVEEAGSANDLPNVALRVILAVYCSQSPDTRHKVRSAMRTWESKYGHHFVRER